MKSNRNSYCLILILDLDIPRIFKDCLCWHKLLSARNCHLAFFLLKIFNHELFGAIAEEKEVKQILSSSQAHTPDKPQVQVRSGWTQRLWKHLLSLVKRTRKCWHPPSAAQCLACRQCSTNVQRTNLFFPTFSVRFTVYMSLLCFCRSMPNWELIMWQKVCV